MRRVGIRRVKLPSPRTATRTVRIGSPSRWMRSSTFWRTAATGVIVPRSRYERFRRTIASPPVRKTFFATSVICGTGGGTGRRRGRRGGGGTGSCAAAAAGTSSASATASASGALHAATAGGPARRAKGSTISADSTPAATIAGSVAAPQSCDTPSASALFNACSTMHGSSESVQT